MAELKTRPADEDVLTYLNGLEDDQRKCDAFAVLDLVKEITGEEPKLWGSGMGGFGAYRCSPSAPAVGGLPEPALPVRV